MSHAITRFPDSGLPGWAAEDLAALAAAARLLEHPSLAARLANKLGSPIESGIRKLPKGWQEKVQRASQAALQQALALALKTIGAKPSRFPSLARKLHGAAVAGTGAVGGAFGLLALPVELPITTGIMLRSIAKIAQSEGENLAQPEARLACIEVFALGGPSPKDDAAESGYFAARAALAGAMGEASRFLVEKGLAEPGAPVLVRFVARIAQRFSVQVSEKAAAEFVPILGAAGGATINVVFIDHFQSMARGHFAVRRLERKYGQGAVRAAYASLRQRSR
ncbi:MAG: EcsC family protein [Planctomycetes bacterium]|nr:EcsC family protein [Planctomycetota bacterium]